MTGPEGSHGEGATEECFYLDSTPTHSYAKALYKYPQAAFPYARLVSENARAGKDRAEFKRQVTGVFVLEFGPAPDRTSVPVWFTESESNGHQWADSRSDEYRGWHGTVG